MLFVANEAPPYFLRIYFETLKFHSQFIDIKQGVGLLLNLQNIISGTGAILVESNSLVVINSKFYIYLFFMVLCADANDPI